MPSTCDMKMNTNVRDFTGTMNTIQNLRPKIVFVLVMISALSLMVSIFLRTLGVGPEDGRDGRYSKYLDSIRTWEQEGWVSKNLPLADTLESSYVVRRMLMFDDYVYRKFTDGERRLEVFVTFWSARRITPDMIDTHTPDTCWIGSGWTCVKANQCWILDNGHGVKLKSECRIFKNSYGKTEYVTFIQLYGSQVYDNGGRGMGNVANPLLWLRDRWIFLFGHQKGQLFIRISSSIPLDDWAEEQGWKGLLGVLQELVRKNGQD